MLLVVCSVGVQFTWKKYFPRYVDGHTCVSTLLLHSQTPTTF